MRKQWEIYRKEDRGRQKKILDSWHEDVSAYKLMHAVGHGNYGAV